MCSGSALCPEADCPEREIDVIGKNDQLRRGIDLVKTDELRNGIAGKIHICLRFYEQYRDGNDPAFLDLCTELLRGFPFPFPAFLRKTVDGEKPSIVPRAFVRRSGIPKTDEEQLWLHATSVARNTLWASRRGIARYAPTTPYASPSSPSPSNSRICISRESTTESSSCTCFASLRFLL